MIYNFSNGKYQKKTTHHPNFHADQPYIKKNQLKVNSMHFPHGPLADPRFSIQRASRMPEIHR